jgi:hypothetical protein
MATDLIINIYSVKYPHGMITMDIPVGWDYSDFTNQCLAMITENHSVKES